MAIDETRQRLSQRIQVLIEQSGVDLSALTSDQHVRLISSLTDGLLVTMNDMLGELDDTPAAAATLTGDMAEQILWEGRPFLSLVEHYTVTTQRVRLRRGLIGRDTDDIELIRIQDVDLTQNVSERMVNIGDITLQGADKSQPIAVLRNIHEPEKVHELIRQAVLAARRRFGVRVRDDI